MQVEISCRHGSISDEVRTHIHEKSEKLLTYFGRLTQIDVTIDFQHEQAVVEILVDAEHKHNLVARDQAENVIAAFDSALHKMEHQIRKYKEKIQDHRRTPSTSEVAADPAAEQADEEE